MKEETKNKIAVLANIATIVSMIGVVTGIVGLYFTYAQISQSTQLAEANVVLQLQESGRQMIEDATSDNFRSYLYGTSEEKNDEKKSKCRALFYKLIQFYSSVFNQHQLGILPENHWNTFKQEFCAIASSNRGKANAKTIQNGRYSPAFKEEYLSCFKV